MNIISVTLNYLIHCPYAPLHHSTVVICTSENPIKGRAADGTHFFHVILLYLKSSIQPNFYDHTEASSL